MGWNYISTLYWACDYLSMLGLNLVHVSKRGPWCLCPLWIYHDHDIHIKLWYAITHPCRFATLLLKLCRQKTMDVAGIIFWMHPTNERRHYIVTWSPVGWVHTQNDPWCICSSMSLLEYVSGADSRFAPTKWEAASLWNDASHWLGASLESALC